MNIFDSAKEKLAELTETHGDQVESISDQAIEKAGDAADQATGGQFAEHVDTADLQEIAVVKVDNAVDMGGAHELVNHFHRHLCTAPRWRNRGQSTGGGLT